MDSIVNLGNKIKTALPFIGLLSVAAVIGAISVFCRTIVKIIVVLGIAAIAFILGQSSQHELTLGMVKYHDVQAWAKDDKARQELAEKYRNECHENLLPNTSLYYHRPEALDKVEAHQCLKGLNSPGLEKVIEQAKAKVPYAPPLLFIKGKPHE